MLEAAVRPDPVTHKRSRMARRLIFGPILILLTIGLMWLDDRLTGAALPAWLAWVGFGTGRLPPATILLLLGLVACGRGGWELARMFRAAGIHASKKSMAFSASAGVLAGGLCIGGEADRLWSSLQQTTGVTALSPGTVLATSAGLVVFLSMVAYLRHREHTEVASPRAVPSEARPGMARLIGASGAVAAAVFAFVYCGVILGFLAALVRGYSVWVMLAVVFVVKACDSGAYFTGTFTPRERRRPLIPWISPGKTWQGLIGGLVTAGLFGLGLAWLSQGVDGAGVRLPLVHGVVLGVLLGLVGQLGDLSASVLKRDAQLKDAGRILPGFGGVIDMLDSLLIAAPVAYWYLAVIGPG
jgi:phosphatidate cytidylyltransferase